MKAKGKAIIIGLLLVSVLTGCGNKESAKEINTSAEESSKKVELTDRQKALLEKEGLPLDYYELTSPWQTELKMMEIGMQYLEEKYPEDEFEYLGYQPPEMGGSYHYVTARSKLIGERYSVHVNFTYSDGGWIFDDDYGAVSESYAYAEEVAKYIQGKYPNAEMFYDGSISADCYEEGDSNILTRASGSVEICINDVFEDEEELKNLLIEISDWMIEKRSGEGKGIWITVLSDEDFKSANIDNYVNEYRKKNKDIYTIHCLIYDSEKVKLFVK